jgi:hypothetical protein
MQKNKGCEYCTKDCKNKDRNAYFYCDKFVNNPQAKKIDLPDCFNDILGGFNKHH